VFAQEERSLFFYYSFIYYFFFYANPLPSFIPRSLNLHNRQVDDCVAGEEEVLLKGVVVVAGQWRRTGWGGNVDIEGAMQSMICVIKRGGDAGREVAIQQTASAREMVAQRERRRCNNQPAQERRSARRETVA
jgi:hypothetical protein